MAKEQLKIFTTKKELSNYLDFNRRNSKTVGFVPTMGALHDGHFSLIKLAAKKSDIIVCSIFVNPTQFNDPNDLEKYPRPIEEDIRKLKLSSCNVLFLPETAEMYSTEEKWHADLGEIENALEGQYRIGHYQGVTQIVKKLFDTVQADFAFFGQKDYQQFCVIQKMVRLFNIPIKLILCPTVREKTGLAMSSRNIYLSENQLKNALKLSEVLELTKRNFKLKSLEQLKTEAFSILTKDDDIKPDYFEICTMDDLKPATMKDKPLIALVAAYVGTTRLIDNIILN